MNHEEEYAAFVALLGQMNVPESFDREFLFDVFDSCLEGARQMKENGTPLARLGINGVQLVAYIVHEHGFYLSTHPDRSQEELTKDENYATLLASISLDKYYTNERLAYSMGALASKYNPLISTMGLYLNFVLGMLSRYKRNDPKETLLVDILHKGFQVAKCVLELLQGGYETEAFSSWRTLHENECILTVLVKYGQPAMERYLRHIQYGIAFRGGYPSKEETDKIFVEIKENMRALGLKSKDMKRYIEYGWMHGVPRLSEDFPDFKLNFRDGVERVAGLDAYNKVYEMSSEVAHSSPVLIYSRKNYFFYLSILNLYESFFRLEKIFSSLYTSTVSEQEKQSYLKMRQLYYGELLVAYNMAKQNFLSTFPPSKKAEAPEEAGEGE